LALARHYLDKLRAWENLYIQGGVGVEQALTCYDKDRGHVEQLQAWVAKKAAVSDEAAHLCNIWPQAGPYILRLRLSPAQHITWTEAALTAARRLNHRDMEAQHLGQLGNAYIWSGQAQRALECYEQALEVGRALDNPTFEATTLGNIGMAYGHLGRMDASIVYIEKQRDIAEKINDDRLQNLALNNLGIAYAKIGNNTLASAAYRQSLSLAEQRSDFLLQSYTLNGLGCVYRQVGQTHEGLRCHQESLRIKRVLGDQRGIVNSLVNIALIYLDLNDPKLAIEHCQEGLRSLEYTVDASHHQGDRRTKSTILETLGIAYERSGDIPRALVCHEESVHLAQEVQDRLGVSSTLAWLGKALVSAGQSEQGLASCEQALEIAQAIQGRLESGLAHFHASLALYALGRPREAFIRAQTAAHIFEDIHSPEVHRVHEVLLTWGTAGPTPALNQHNRPSPEQKQLNDAGYSGYRPG
jgi:tetratricopeptide (TPR) repeat protein